MNLFSDNFDMWKLNSIWDYLSFFAYLLIGIVIFVIAARYLSGQRNHEAALKRTVRRLRRLAGRRSRLYEEVYILWKLLRISIVHISLQLRKR